MAQRSLRRNFSWALAGNVGYAACQWGILVVLVKVGSPEMVGRFALALAVTAPVVMLSNLQLRAVQVTDARHEYRFGDYLALRLLTSGAALLVMAGLSLAYNLETALVILAVALAKIVESISDVYHGLLQVNERLDSVAQSLLLKGLLSLVALGCAVALTSSVYWGAAALALTWLLVLLCYDVPRAAAVCREAPEVGHILRPHWDRGTLGHLLRQNFPLGLTMMLISLNVNVPRYFIDIYLGQSDLGIFSALTAFGMAGSQVVNALGQSMSPRLARSYAQGDRLEVRRLLTLFAAVATFLGAGGVIVALLAGHVLLTFVFTPEYAQYQDIFVLVMAAAGIGYLTSVFGYATTASRRIRLQPTILLAVLGVSCAAAILLIPSQQLMGAALSVMLSSLVGMLGYFCLLWTRSESLPEPKT
jgi:O-antigen/teichoic acid export membrane protein